MLKMPPVQSQYWGFIGGLDQVTPPVSIKPGVVRAASNFEVGTNGGYARVAGYERYSGQTRPSTATYHILNVTITGSYALGNTITGATSGATGVLIAVVTGASAYFVITKLTGTFQAETINISGSPVATSSGASQSGAASTSALNATYLNLAADQYRNDIAAPTGSGSILGVWQYNSNLYCFRNNAGGTAALMYKASSSGWTAVTLFNEVSFTAGGTATPADGATLTQGGVTATVKRIVLTSGAWTGTAAGRFIVTNPSGGNFAAGAATLTGGATVTLSGVQTAISFSPNGRFEFVNHNFGGSSGTTKMYGCDGVNRAFEFDGTTVVPITSGMTTDTPQHIAAHKKQLFLSFGGSIQHSGIGTPYVWSVVLGAAELVVGEQCTGMLVQPGGTTVGTMTIYTRNNTYILYGNSTSDWNLVTFNAEAGAVEWTPQFIGQGIVLDDRGVTTLATSQNFGNFNSATISRTANPFLLDLRDTAAASCIVREKNQYRLFFSGGDALYVTFIDGKLGGCMPVTLTNPVTCICSQEAGSGVEEIYFGSSNGMVYQMDKGTSFDGGTIAWTLTMAYNHFGSPMQLKQFRNAQIEVTGDSYASFEFGYSIGYGSTDIPQPANETITSSFSPSTWDSFTWDSFFWDGQTLIPSQVDLDGTAENLSFSFTGTSDEFSPFTINGAMVAYTSRRRLR